MKQQKLEESKEYKYGFVTDIESIKAPKGLNEKVIKFISKEKKEPKSFHCRTWVVSECFFLYQFVMENEKQK